MPFRTTDAAAYGLTSKMLRARRFASLGRGVVIAAQPAGLSLRDRVRAGLLVLPPGTVVIGVTGLRLRGVDVGRDLPLRFASTHRHPVRRADVVVQRVTSLPPLAQGLLPLATVEHCFVTAAGELDLLELVIAGDRLLRRKLTTKARLGAYLARSPRRGVRLARRALTLMAERVDSPRETTLRLCLVLAGLPTPECNLTLGTDSYPIGRVDLVYVEFKLIIEYEGDQHRTDKLQWNIDIDRVDEFTAEGYLVLRITAARMRRPRSMVAKVFAELRRRGYTGPAPVFSEEWCRLFESTVQ